MPLTLRKRSASMSSLMDASRRNIEDTKPQRPGLIRKISQTFSKPTDVESPERTHRPRKLSLSNIMSSVKASASHTSLLLGGSKETETASPARQKPSKANHRMDLRPGQHTADRMYDAIPLSRSKPKRPMHVSKESIRRVDNHVVNRLGHPDALGLELWSEGEKGGRSGSEQHSVESGGNGLDVARKGRSAVSKAESTAKQMGTALVQAQPSRHPDGSQVRSRDMSMIHGLCSSLKVVELGRADSTHPSAPTKMIDANLLDWEKEALRKLPKYQPQSSLAMPNSAKSFASSSTASVPLSLNTIIDRAPPRQSLPLTPADDSASVYTFPANDSIRSLSPVDRVVIQPHSTWDSDSDSLDDEDDSDDSTLESESCYSQSSYHPSVLGRDIDATMKLVQEFRTAPDAPPVPTLPFDFTHSQVYQRNPFDRALVPPPKLDRPPTPPPKPVPVLPLAHNASPPSRTQAPALVPVTAPTPLPTRAVANRAAQAEKRRPAPLKSVPSPSKSLSPTAQYSSHSAHARTSKPVPCIPARNATPVRSHVELYRQSSAREARRVNPPSRPHSPEFYSTPPAVPSHLSANPKLFPCTNPTSASRFYPPLSSAPRLRKDSPVSGRSSLSSALKKTPQMRELPKPVEAGGPGLRSWKKSDVPKVSGQSWYTPALPLEYPRAASQMQTKETSPLAKTATPHTRTVVDSNRTSVPAPHGVLPVPKASPSSRHIQSNSSSSSQVHSQRPPAASRSRSDYCSVPRGSATSHSRQQYTTTDHTPSGARPVLAHAPASEPVLSGGWPASVVSQYKLPVPLRSNRAEQPVKIRYDKDVRPVSTSVEFVSPVPKKSAGHPSVPTAKPMGSGNLRKEYKDGSIGSWTFPRQM